MAFAIVIKTLEMTRTKESYLDEGDTKGVGSQVRLDLLEELTEELEGRNREDFKYLVRKNEDENGSVLHGLANIGDGDDVVSELVTRKIREESRNSRLSTKKKGYLTFSCSVLMISVSLRPLMISSKTHIFTSLLKMVYFLTFLLIRMEAAEPLRLESLSVRHTSFRSLRWQRSPS